MHLESLKNIRTRVIENEDEDISQGLESISVSSHSDDGNFDRYASVLATPTWNASHPSPERYASCLGSLNSDPSDGDWVESTHFTPIVQTYEGDRPTSDFPASYAHPYEGDYEDDSTYHTDGGSQSTFVQLAFHKVVCPLSDQRIACLSPVHRTVCLSSAHENFVRHCESR